MVKFEEMSTQDDNDESDKHLEARDRRYSCLKTMQSLDANFVPSLSLVELFFKVIEHFSMEWIGI